MSKKTVSHYSGCLTHNLLSQFSQQAQLAKFSPQAGQLNSDNTVCVA